MRRPDWITSSAKEILVCTVMLGASVGAVLLIVNIAQGMDSRATAQADQTSSVASSPTPSEQITSGGSKAPAKVAAKATVKVAAKAPATTAVVGPTAPHV